LLEPVIDQRVISVLSSSAIETEEEGVADEEGASDEEAAEEDEAASEDEAAEEDEAASEDEAAAEDESAAGAEETEGDVEVEVTDEVAEVSPHPTNPGTQAANVSISKNDFFFMLIPPFKMT